MVASAGVIAAALAGADQNAAIETHRRLADLNVDAFMVEGDFAANGDAGLVVSQVVASGRESESASLRSRARAVA